MTKNSNRAFTLIEILVVIAIIGILSSVVLVSLNNSRNKAKETRILSSITQFRSIFESNYANNSFTDIVPLGDGSQVAVINSSSPSLAEIVTLLADISVQNGGSNIATLSGNNVDLFSDATNVQVGPTPPGSLANATDTGVVIFTTNTTGSADDYAVYATTTAGYVCVDSSGNVIKAGEGSLTGSFIASVPLSNGRVICQ